MSRNKTIFTDVTLFQNNSCFVGRNTLWLCFSKVPVICVRNLSKKEVKSARNRKLNIKKFLQVMWKVQYHMYFSDLHEYTLMDEKTYCMKQEGKLFNAPTDTVFTTRTLLAGPWPISLKPLTWISYSVCATSLERTVSVMLLVILISL